jgi:hypothetical protein
VLIPCLPGGQRGPGYSADVDPPTNDVGKENLFAALLQHAANVTAWRHEQNKQQQNALNAPSNGATTHVPGKCYGDPLYGKHLLPSSEFDTLNNVVSESCFLFNGILILKKVCANTSACATDRQMPRSTHFLVTNLECDESIEQETHQVSDRVALDQLDSAMSWRAGWGYLTPEKLQALLRRQECRTNETLQALEDAIAMGGNSHTVRAETI